MNASLLAIIETRLNETADVALDPAARAVVLAACHGGQQLSDLLDGGTEQVQAMATGVSDAMARGVFLASLDVRGFRGVGPRARLEVPPGPGLVLVVGRNGSGKSSFAEALELLLTGVSFRWKDKSKVWTEGWRNLHDGDRPELDARFTAEGRKQSISVRCAWQPGDDLDADRLSVDGATVGTLGNLGWEDALVTYRPFLSYGELGSLFDAGPSQLYDTVSAVLGLDDLVETRKALQEQRLSRTKRLDGAAKDLVPLLAELQASDDERATRCLQAVATKPWDLAALRETLEQSDVDPDPEGARGVLQSLASLAAPDPEDVRAAAEDLCEAAASIEALKGTDADRASRLADLMAGAVFLHDEHGDADCPVCGNEGVLDAPWRERATAELERLRSDANELRAARTREGEAVQGATQLVTQPPRVLERAAGVGIDASAAEAAWGEWVQLPGLEPRALAGHLTSHISALDEAVGGLRREARRELDAREDQWRPLARRLLTWCGQAEPAAAGATVVPAIVAAEDWLKAAGVEIREERFAPIAEAARENWSLLRQQSSVSLDEIALAGSGPRRRLSMEVSIDGQPGAALGVMSQGELNSLSLSIFLPRAMLPESPFRFLVIDDPVQSMDPAKVDGLARVLDRAAAHRQVVVFTHDDRLAEAARRLQISARVIEVSRRADSVVELRVRSTPWDQALDDARAFARSDAPHDVAANVVPGLCRAAIEALCTDQVRRRLISGGTKHDEADERLAGAVKLKSRLALMLFDDPNRAGDVLGRLNRTPGSWAADVVHHCDRGSHHGHPGDLDRLVSDTSRLLKALGAP